MPLDLALPAGDVAGAGLSDREAAGRLMSEGFNELPSSKPSSVLRISADVVREPMLLLLIATGAVYLLLGDLDEAVALLGAVFVVIGITMYQEHKTERTLTPLRDLSSPRALVIRDGVGRANRGSRGVASAEIPSCMARVRTNSAMAAHFLSCLTWHPTCSGDQTPESH